MSSSPSVPRGPRPAGARVVLPVLAAAAAVATVVVGLGWWAPLGLHSGLLSVAGGVLGAGCCLWASVHLPGVARWSWLSFAAVLLCYAVADSLWLAFGGAEGDPPVLSVADSLYLAALAPAVGGLLVYPVVRGGLVGWRDGLGPLLMDVVVLGSATLLACDVLVFDEVAERATDRLEVFMYLVYPVTDVVLVCLVLAMLLRSKGDRRPDVVLVGLSFAVLAAADNGYALLAVRGQDTIGTVVDLGYVLSPVLLGSAALLAVSRPRRTRTAQRASAGVGASLLPDLVTTVALALFVTLGRDTGWAAGTFAALTLTLAGLRQLAVTADRQRLRRDAERRAARRTEELRQLTQEYQRLEGLKHGFVASVSHELRTPLTAIQGSLEVLVDGDTGDLAPPTLDVLGVALRGTRRLARLVEDIIDLERLHQDTFTLHTEAQPLAPLVVDAVATLSPAARVKGVRLVVDGIRDDVVGDGDRIVQMIVNLVGNAVKFSPAGATVSVATAATTDEVVVAVSDEGCGIPAPQLQSVFERFHQVDAGGHRGHGGAGLGLAITRRLVEAHGGRIWVESTPEVGSTFRFTLPRAPWAAVTPCDDVAAPPGELPGRLPGVAEGVQTAGRSLGRA